MGRVCFDNGSVEYNGCFFNPVVDEGFVEKGNLLGGKPEGKFLRACKGDIVKFSEFMLGVSLYAWQKVWLKRLERAIHDEDDSTRLFSALTSRQIGKSWSVAIFALWACVFNKYDGGGEHGNTQIGIVSASDGQAKKLLREVKKFIRLGDNKMLSYKDGDGEPLFGKEFFSSLLDSHQPNNTTTITFESYDEECHGSVLLAGSKIGSYIVSLPPTDGVLGYTFSILLIDEAGKSGRISDEFFVDIAGPTTDALDALTIYTSTPWQPSGRFFNVVHKSMEEDKKDVVDSSVGEVFKFTLDAIKIEDRERYDKIRKKIKVWEEDGMVDSVRRAYYCEFVKGEESYFVPDDVRDCFDEDWVSKFEFSGKCDMGVDFGGRVNSQTVITISYWDEDEECMFRLFHKVYPVNDDDSLIDDISSLKGVFNVQRIVVDDCPRGQTYIYEMEDDQGWDVERMNFRSDKVAKYGCFRKMLHRGKVVSYPDERLKTEMLALENSSGRRQSYISAPPGYSDDRIDSFVMSCYFYLDDEGSGVKTYNLW